MKNEWKTCLRWGITVVLVFLVARYWDTVASLLYAVKAAAGPLIFGCILAYIVNIPMACYERCYMKVRWLAKHEKLKRPFCMFLAVISVLVVLWLVLEMIIPELIACINLLIQRLPGAIGMIFSWIETHLPVEEWFGEVTLKIPDISDIQDLVKHVGTFLVNGFGTAVNTVAVVVTSVVSGVVTVFVGVVFAVYLLAGKERIAGQCKMLIHRFTKEKVYRTLYMVLETLNDCFHKFIVGQCTEAVILGALCMIGMLILRLPYAAMIGCLIGVTALIPVAGAYIGAIVGAVMILTVSPIKALVFVIYLVVLQQLEGNLIYPRVVGNSIGLPGIWVLAAITIGGGVMGVMGMLLGVPVAATIYVLLRKCVIAKRSAVAATEDKKE